MGSISNIHLKSNYLLREAKRFKATGRLKEAEKTILKILESCKNLHHVTGKKVQLSNPEGSTRSDVCTLEASWLRVVLECGQVLNSLMCFDKAVTCFELADLFPFAQHQSQPDEGLNFSQGYVLRANFQLDIIQASVQTHLYQNQTAEADKLIQLIVIDNNFGLGKVDDGFSGLPRARIVSRKLLLDLAHLYVNEGKHEEAMSQLTHMAWKSHVLRRVIGFAARCMEAERYNLLAYTRYKVGTSAQEDTSRNIVEELFRDVYRLWERMKWPLDYSETIIRMLARYAIERIEHGHFGAENPIVKTMLDLNHKVWKHCGELSFSVGQYMYDVAFAAEKIKKHLKSAQYGEKTVAIFRECPQYMKERTIFIGASLYLVGINYFHENKLDLAMQNIEDCIPILEKSAPKKDSAHYLFAMETLAQAYVDMADALNESGHAADRSLVYSEKALANRKFLTHSDIKVAQASRANSLYCKGALLEHERNLIEAEAIYVEADNMYAETVIDCTESFEFISYGYFLYRRENYTKASRMLQLGYDYDLADTEFPSLKFTHNEWHTLTAEMKFEVQHSVKKIFDVPNRMVALYFRIMSLLGSGVEPGDEEISESVKKLDDSVRHYDYITCGMMGKMPSGMYRCSSLSLLGYTYRALGKHGEAAKSFKKAFNSYSCESARLNMAQDTQKAQELDAEENFDSNSESDDEVNL